MSTKKEKPDPEQSIGRPDAVDLYPRIVWAAHVMEGQPHLRGTEVTLMRILTVLADHVRLPPAAMLTPLIGHPVTDTDLRTTLRFAADMMKHLTAMEAELVRQVQRATQTATEAQAAAARSRKRKSRKRKEATHEPQKETHATTGPPDEGNASAHASGDPARDHDPDSTRH
jgi:uncharacterized protein (DUF433 family)